MDEVRKELEKLLRIEEQLMSELHKPEEWGGVKPSCETYLRIGVYHLGYADALRAVYMLLKAAQKVSGH